MTGTKAHGPLEPLQLWMQRDLTRSPEARVQLGTMLAQLGRELAGGGREDSVAIAAGLERAAKNSTTEEHPEVEWALWATCQFVQGFNDESSRTADKHSRQQAWASRGQRARTLLALSDAPTLRPLELAGILDISKGAAWKLLRSLEHDGLATRTTSLSDDGRASSYEITMIGEREAAELRRSTVLPQEGIRSERVWQLVQQAAELRSSEFDVDTATELLSTANAIATDADDPQLLSAVLGEQTTTHRQAGQLSAAEGTLAELIKHAERHKANAVVQARAQYERGRLAVHEDPKGARELLSAARDHLAGATTRRDLVRLYWCEFALADLARQTGRLFEASAAAHRAATGFSDLGDRYSELCALTLGGFIFRLAGDFQGASRTLEHAADTAGRYRRRRAEALYHLGEVNRARGDLETSRSQLTEALDLWSGLQQPTAVAFGLAAHGALRFQADDPKRAVDLLGQAASLMPAHHAEGRALVLRRLGTACRESGDHERARRYLAEAAALYEHRVMSPFGQAEALVGLAKVDKAKHRLRVRQAVDALESIKIRPRAEGSPLSKVALPKWVFDEAGEIARRADAELLVERVRVVESKLDHLARVDIGAPGEVLTEMSREPLALVA